MNRWCHLKENLAASNNTCKISLINGAEVALQDWFMFLMYIKKRTMRCMRIALVFFGDVVQQLCATLPAGKNY